MKTAAQGNARSSPSDKTTTQASCAGNNSQAVVADDAALIQAFRLLWDAFPGMARLLTKKHKVLAVNARAAALGYTPGISCADVSAPALHRGCRMVRACRTGLPQFALEHGVLHQGWIPVAGRQDVVVHFCNDTFC